MKKLLAALLAVFALLTAACGSTNQSQVQTGEIDRSKQEITVLTGPESGIYYPIGSAFSRVLADQGYKSTAVATAGTAENITDIQNHKGDIAIAMSDAVIQAIGSFGIYQDQPPAEDLRVMMGLWPNVVQIVTTESSGIKSFADLQGKRVAVGAKESGVEANARMIFEAHGMSYADITPEYLAYGDAISQVKAGNCDAAFVTSGLGNETIKALGGNIAFVPVAGEAQKKLMRKYPFYIEWTIPRDVYGTADDTPTVAVMNVMLVSKDLPDDVVFDMLGAIYSRRGLETIGLSHPTAQAEISLDTALRGIVGTNMKLHPGAEKYYREMGIHY